MSDPVVGGREEKNRVPFGNLVAMVAKFTLLFSNGHCYTFKGSLPPESLSDADDGT